MAMQVKSRIEAQDHPNNRVSGAKLAAFAAAMRRKGFRCAYGEAPAIKKQCV